MPDITLAFGPFTPDRPEEKSGSTEALNVLPKTGGGYEPLPDLSASSAALDARCQGAAAVIDTSGTVHVFAGDATKLYKLTATDATWEDVSKVGGYTIASEERWRFELFGSRVIATDFADAIQSYILGSSTDFADLAAAAPKARHLATARGFLFAINTFDGTYGEQPQRLWWSALEDPTSWPTPGSAAAIAVQSDYQDLVGNGGWNQAGVSGLSNADLLIFQERAMWRASYVGASPIWTFDQIEGGRGTPAPGSVVQWGGVAYFLGEDGFYKTDGVSSVGIGTTEEAAVDRWFFDNVDWTYLSRMTGAVDPVRKLIMWAFPSSSAASGINDRLLVYNILLGRFTHAEVNTETLLRSLSLGTTWDQLDNIASTIDTVPFSFDSKVWSGGRSIMAAFDTSHKLASFGGSNLAATLETAEMRAPAGRRLFVRGIRPLVNNTAGAVTASVGMRAQNQGDALTYTTATAQGVDGMCPQRATGRVGRAKVIVAAGATWDTAEGAEVSFALEGRR